jgi:hypothetical protein
MVDQALAEFRAAHGLSPSEYLAIRDRSGTTIDLDKVAAKNLGDDDREAIAEVLQALAGGAQITDGDLLVLAHACGISPDLIQGLKKEGNGAQHA